MKDLVIPWPETLLQVVTLPRSSKTIIGGILGNNEAQTPTGRQEK